MVRLRRRGPDPLDFSEPRSPLASARRNEHVMPDVLADRRAMARSQSRRPFPIQSLRGPRPRSPRRPAGECTDANFRARCVGEAFTPDLAMSLNTLAVRLSALGRREEALTAAQEAADLYRGLARARAEAFTPDLAGRVGRDYVGETCGGENEPQRAHVAGRHVV